MIKNIKNYEGLYQIDEDGNVWSIRTGKCLIGSIENGYKRVDLTKDGVSKHFYVHRLVAENFIPNPNNFPVINHKDENRLNNNVDNLEWCTYYQNNVYGNRLKKCYKPVRCVETSMVYESQVQAQSETGIASNRINEVCRGHRKTAGGYHWEYAN